MPEFEAVMRVTHNETWTVEAENAEEARKKIDALHEDVVDDDTGGEVVDWEIKAIRPVAI